MGHAKIWSQVDENQTTTTTTTTTTTNNNNNNNNKKITRLTFRLRGLDATQLKNERDLKRDDRPLS